MTTNDMRLNSQHVGGMAAALGVASAMLFVVGWAWDHQYVQLLFAAAPIVAIAGLAFAVTALRRRNEQAGLLAFIGGAVSVLVLLGYVYALLAYAGGGN